MDDLVAYLRTRLDLDEATARAVVVIVIQFLGKEAPADVLAPLFAVHPWAQALTAEAPEVDATELSERHFGGMARLMLVADRMMAHGLTMAQVQFAVHEIVAYARTTVGDEPVDRLVRAVPGLRQVV
ncbi:hypothetical protein [Xanthobacter autotrophicus]|uniref:hypothetical protein n=1 Tax=Xanthobacter autotrophicus TaxID=280 RepID=UPI0024A73793|nr:hypothetical protein [Xanthobacter autotrophicus]MDI4659189.1 hypothetical protein [Xanthobacter autotrophicus]